LLLVWVAPTVTWAAASERDPGLADIPDVPAGRELEQHDSDLLHMIFGVAI